jgi:hypothetical protein
MTSILGIDENPVLKKLLNEENPRKQTRHSSRSRKYCE